MPIEHVDIKEEFKTTRQGKPFVLYAGLIDAFHRKYHDCTVAIITDLEDFSIVDGKPEYAVVKCEVVAKDGEREYTFSGIGDATRKNVGSMVVEHLIRMAGTRAKARALRDAVNVAVAAVEELGASDGGHVDEHDSDEVYRSTLFMNLEAAARKAGYSQNAITRAILKWDTYSNEELVKALDELRNVETE